MSNNNMELNKCTRCLQLKTFDMFIKDKKRKTGIRNLCKQYNSEMSKIHRKNNRDSYLEKR